jgi:hypothetical protein
MLTSVALVRTVWLAYSNQLAMDDTLKRGSTGIGGLLLLLALIIVAMIAAGTVLYLAGELRQQTDELPYISVVVIAVPYWQLYRAQ